MCMLLNDFLAVEKPDQIVNFVYSLMQSDRNSLKIDTSRGYNFWTYDVILIFKAPTCPYSFLAKVINCS